jgi:hypothetical protein
VSNKSTLFLCCADLDKISSPKTPDILMILQQCCWKHPVTDAQDSLQPSNIQYTPLWKGGKMSCLQSSFLPDKNSATCQAHRFHGEREEVEPWKDALGCTQNAPISVHLHIINGRVKGVDCQTQVLVVDQLTLTQLYYNFYWAHGVNTAETLSTVSIVSLWSSQ